MNKEIFIGGNHVARKDYVDEQVSNLNLSKQNIIQYSTMPTASAEAVGRIIQYTGTTTQDYVNGYFYIGIVEGEVGEEVYSWKRLAVQPETEIPADLNIHYIEVNNSQNPFIFSEHQTGAYMFKTNQVNIMGTGQAVYLKFSTDSGTVFSQYIKYDEFLLYIKDVRDVQQGDRIASIVRLNIDGSLLLTTGVYNLTYGPFFDSKIGYYNSISTKTLIDTEANQTISGKKTFTTLPESSVTPTTANQLVNKSYVDSLASAALKRQKVQTLPTEDIRTDTIYMVPSSDPEQGNVLDEYMYIDDAWEKIGSSSVDLTDYYTKDEVNTLLDNRLGDIDTILDDILNGSVDAEEREY